MAQYTQAPEVEDIANKLIEKYHNHLQGFKIIYLFRDKAMKSKGKEVYGKASKVQSILSHDFEGFNKELKRHGFWASDLQIMKKQLQQMELPFNEKPELKVVSG